MTCKIVVAGEGGNDVGDDVSRVHAEAELQREGHHLPNSFYYAEWHSLSEGKRRSRRSIDQTVKGGAAGALALSIVFLENIAPQPLPETLHLVRWGWVALVASLATGLLSFWTSEMGYGKALKQLDELDRTGVDERDTGGWDGVTSLLNLAALLTLATGVALIVLFAWENFTVEAMPE